MDSLWNITHYLDGDINHTFYAHDTDLALVDSKSHSPEHKIISSIGIVVLMIVSLSGNALVCLAVYQSKQLQSSVNYFFVSLAFSDILIGLISMPLWLTFELTKFKGLPSTFEPHALLKGWTFIDILSGVASISNLVSISFERYFSIKSPLSHRMCMLNSYVVLNVLVVWVYSLLVASVYIGIWSWKWKVLLTAVIGFALPFCFIVFSYLNVFLIVRKIPQNVISRQENHTVTRTLCILVVAFVVCWAPFFVVSITTIHCSSCQVYVMEQQWIRSFVIWLHYLNSCCNPFLYCIFNAYYKDAFKAVLKKIFVRKAADVMMRQAKDSRPHSQTRSTVDRFSHVPFLDRERLSSVDRPNPSCIELPLKETFCSRLMEVTENPSPEPRYVEFDFNEFKARREMAAALSNSTSTDI